MMSDPPTTRADHARAEMCLTVAAAILGMFALTQRSAVTWVLFKAGVPAPWLSPWVWLPPLTVSAACFHVAWRLMRHGTVPAVSALVAFAGWAMILLVEVAWWVR
ncbi:hypothetical protein [Nonomuraea roseoviolacea]|uniref:Uncharacterized protein n=1 Tax=Nonomuraea roseoviolacea subsp. carminata TaxID=160689 RepID=A0ABT1K9A9_9ACTN|nr:hypothetical protein [Nonomuraea roseoviolacea]MCP2350593.1 hypothetical protein [Nonomuraea roseoviolacea subsp. carminata]